MPWRGRYQLGDIVPLGVRATNGSGTPTVPDQAPVATIVSDSAQVLTLALPIVDRYGITAWFSYPLHLSGIFAAGTYRVVYDWVIGGTAYGSEDTFEIAAGGDGEGAGLSMFWFGRPTSDFLLLQTDGGRIIRRRNPRIA